MKRVLVVRLSAMGDVVQSLGAVRALADARPDLELHFVTQRAYVALLDGLEFLRSVIAHDRHPSVRGYVGTGRRLRELAPEIALDLQGNWKSAGFARLSGARLRIGSAGALRREPRSRVLLNHLVGRPGESRHPARLATQVVQVLAPDAIPGLPRLVATAAEIDREAAALAGIGVDPTRPFRLLVVSTARDPRAWRVPWMRAAERESDLPCVWVAGPAERRVVVPSRSRCLRHGLSELRRLVALGHVAAAADGDVLGPDLGATHVLAATGVRTRVLFGPTDPGRTAPPAAEALVAAPGPPCRPCRSRVCRHPDGPVCMEFTLAESATIRDDGAS